MPDTDIKKITDTFHAFQQGTLEDVYKRQRWKYLYRRKRGSFVLQNEDWKLVLVEK